jgi:hypothetical protein
MQMQFVKKKSKSIDNNLHKYENSLKFQKSTKKVSSLLSQSTNIKSSEEKSPISAKIPQKKSFDLTNDHL